MLRHKAGVTGDRSCMAAQRDGPQPYNGVPDDGEEGILKIDRQRGQDSISKQEQAEQRPCRGEVAQGLAHPRGRRMTCLFPPLRDNTPHHHNAQQGQCEIGRGTTLARGKEEAIWTGSTEPLTTYFRGTACRSQTFSMTCPSGAAGWCWGEKAAGEKVYRTTPNRSLGR